MMTSLLCHHLLVDQSICVLFYPLIIYHKMQATKSLRVKKRQINLTR